MLLLPFERISLESSRTPEELVAALERVTKRPQRRWVGLRRRPETTTFVGEVSRDRLYFRRAITHRNSFIPFVVGKIVNGPFCTRLEAILRPNAATLALLGVFTLALAPGVIAGLGQFIRHGMFKGLEWVPIAVVAGLYVMCTVSFVPEARKTLRLLREIAGPRAMSFEPR
jgi:hypothetical protein